MKRVLISFVVLILVALNFSNRLMARLPEADPPPHVEIVSLVNHQKVAVGQAVLLEAHGSNPDWSIGEYWFYANDVLIGQLNPTLWRPTMTGSVVITCIVKRDPDHPVVSEPVTIQVAVPPVMKLLAPLSSVVLSAPASLDLEVGASAVGGVIRRVRFLDGTLELGVVANPPYRLHVDSLRYRRPIMAVAEDDSGLTTELVFPVTILGMPGDEFVRPLPLSGAHAVDHVSNREASDQVVGGWVQNAFTAAGKSIWWTWTAPSDGTATISTEGSNFDTVLGVLVSTNRSGQLSYSHLITSYNGLGVAPASFVKIQVRKGLEYRIVVDAAGGGFGGDIQLKLDLLPAFGNGLPSNDQFASREPLTGRFLPQSFNTLGASLESNERGIVTNVPGGRSIWWEWHPDQAGVATITTRGSAFDTVLGVYTFLIGNNPVISNLKLLAANDDDSGGGSHSTVRLVADPSVQYVIAVDGFWGLGGAGVLTLDLDSKSVSSPPVNDSVARRIRIPGDQLIQYATTLKARNDSDAPQFMNTAVWWGWTPSSDQTAFVTTAGSSSTTQVGVYYYNKFGGLNQEALSNRGIVEAGRLLAEASFVAIAGREYIIGVATIAATKSEGAIQMQVIPGPALEGLPLAIDGVDLIKGVETVSLGVNTPRRALLLASPDLINWRVIRTNTFAPGIPLELPIGLGETSFLKAYGWNNP